MTNLISDNQFGIVYGSGSRRNRCWIFLPVETDITDALKEQSKLSKGTRQMTFGEFKIEYPYPVGKFFTKRSKRKIY
jgi:hypothetical protein